MGETSHRFPGIMSRIPGLLLTGLNSNRYQANRIQHAHVARQIEFAFTRLIRISSHSHINCFAFTGRHDLLFCFLPLPAAGQQIFRQTTRGFAVVASGTPLGSHETSSRLWYLTPAREGISVAIVTSQPFQNNIPQKTNQTKTHEKEERQQAVEEENVFGFLPCPNS